MSMKIIHELGGPNHVIEIVLTDEEVAEIVGKYNYEKNRAWVLEMMEDEGYDIDRYSDKDIEKIILKYEAIIEDAESYESIAIAEAQHNALDEVMQEYENETEE